MREIKFRAKIQGHIGYVFGVPHNVYHDSEHKDKWFDSMQYMDEYGKPTVEYIEQDTLSEYTGLKDKNGVEIYEGDVLRGYGKEIKRYIVSFENGSFVLHHEFARWGLLYRMFEIDMKDMPVEVIGNIHENPELI